MLTKKENTFYQLGWRSLTMALFLIAFRMTVGIFAEMANIQAMISVFGNLFAPLLLLLAKMALFAGAVNFTIGLVRNESLLDALFGFLKEEFGSPDGKKTNRGDDQTSNEAGGDRQRRSAEEKALQSADQTNGIGISDRTPLPAYHWSEDLQRDLARFPAPVKQMPRK